MSFDPTPALLDALNKRADVLERELHELQQQDAPDPVRHREVINAILALRADFERMRDAAPAYEQGIPS